MPSPVKAFVFRLPSGALYKSDFLKTLFKVISITFGVLFAIYMLNLDMKLVGFIYTWLNKFHDKKDSLRDIQF